METQEEGWSSGTSHTSSAWSSGVLLPRDPNTLRCSLHLSSPMFFCAMTLFLRTVSGQGNCEPQESGEDGTESRILKGTAPLLPPHHPSSTVGKNNETIMCTLANWCVLLTQTCVHSSSHFSFYLRNVLGYLKLDLEPNTIYPVRFM